MLSHSFILTDLEGGGDLGKQLRNSKWGYLYLILKKNINFKSVNEMTWVEKRRGGGKR